MAFDLSRVLRWHALGVVGAGGISWLVGTGDPVSVLLGGGVMGANFVMLRVMTQAAVGALAGSETPRVGVAAAAFVGKFLLFVLLMAGLFWRLPIEGMSFAAGATLLVVAILVESLRSASIRPGGVI